MRGRRGASAGFTPRGASAGFTLIEILVVLVIVGLLMATLWGGLRIGVSGWRRVATTTDVLEARGSAERVLRMVIRNLANDDPGCQGDAAHLVCAGMLPDPATGMPRPVRLALGIQGGARLVLRWEARLPGLPGRATARPRIGETIVLTPATGLRLRYFKPGTGWIDRWPTGAGAPDLVRIVIEGGPGTWPAIVEHPRGVFPSTE